jgi:hypothetical protein
MVHLSPAEEDAQANLAALEFPRLVCHANGQQSLVRNVIEARQAIELGATILPTAASPNDGGTPNHDQITKIVGVVVAADAEALTATSLQPDTAEIGDADFVLHVIGTGFLPGAVIVFAGQDEPTTRVSNTELTTGMNMTVWLGADPAIPCVVRNPNGAVSETLLFAFTDSAAAALAEGDEPKSKAKRKR